MRWGWIGLAIVSTVGYLWINPLITIVRLQDEESENLEDADVDDVWWIWMPRATMEPKHRVFMRLLFSAAAQTSALSPTLTGENGRCLETDYLGEKAYDGHHLPTVGLVERGREGSRIAWHEGVRKD